MILEGIVTTRDSTGAVHVAPMGPIVDESLTTLRLRPFKTSQTYQNLKLPPCGVFHVVDDVLLLARSAVGQLAKRRPRSPPKKFPGAVLADCCRWYEFEIRRIRRLAGAGRVTGSGRARGRRARFFRIQSGQARRARGGHPGDARAPDAPHRDSSPNFDRLKPAVSKTGGPAEFEAFALLERYVSEAARAATRQLTGAR